MKNANIAIFLVTFVIIGFISFHIIYSKFDNSNKIVISLSDKICFSSFCIEKISDTWQLAKKPVDKEKIANLNILLSKFRSTDLVSENWDNRQTYGLDDNRWISIGDKKIFIGKDSDDYTGTYFSFDQKKIYQTSQAVFFDSLVSPNYWIDYKITNYPIYQLEKIIIKSGNNQTEIVKVGDNWDKKYNTFIETISHLSAVDIVTESMVISKQIDYEITTEGELGHLSIFTQGSKYYARNINFLYQISPSDYKILTSVLD